MFPHVTSLCSQKTHLALEVENLTLLRQDRPIISNLTFSVSKGSKVAIVGPNGGGKSTFLEALAVNSFSSLRGQGHVRHGVSFPRDMAYLPQNSKAQRHFPLLVRDVVAAGLWHEFGALRPLSSEAYTTIDEALSSVGLKGFSLQPIGALSGGQFQRVLFARMIVQKASFLLLDEPLTAVDSHTQQDLLALIDLWHSTGKTQLVVLHDMALVRQSFPYTLLIARNFSCFGLTDDILIRENLEHAVACAQQWETDL